VMKQYEKIIIGCLMIVVRIMIKVGERELTPDKWNLQGNRQCNQRFT
jgi:hypothetical protein